MNMTKLTLVCALALLSAPAGAVVLKAFQEQARAVVPTDPFKIAPICMLGDEAEAGATCSFFNNTGMLGATVHLNIGVGKESPEDATEGDGNPANKAWCQAFADVQGLIGLHHNSSDGSVPMQGCKFIGLRLCS